MLDDKTRKKIDRASATLAALDVSVYGNTLHVRGLDGSWCPAPQAGAHADGNGGWIAFPGGALVAEALLEAIVGLRLMIAHVIELEEKTDAATD